jgi:branched-chain amino acid transport system ATP-binding protein
VVQDIFRIMQRVRNEQQVAILLVEQNASLALDLADHAYLLETGRIVLAGPAAAVRSHDAVRDAYLGGNAA